MHQKNCERTGLCALQEAESEDGGRVKHVTTPADRVPAHRDRLELVLD
jgi:hypothetical protein